MSIVFSLDAYRKAAATYRQTWATTDETLRKLCLKFPSHKDRAGVHAKVWIIGRTFATGIERAVKSDGSQGSSASTVARHMLQHCDEIDEIFRQVRNLRVSLTRDHLIAIIEAHKAFLRVMKPITTRVTRSFASKYMHFHAPLVPIYDDVAVRSLRARVRWSKSCNDFPLPRQRDDQYAWYAVRFLHLYEKARQKVPTVTVRLLEFSLLHDAGSDEHAPG